MKKIPSLFKRDYDGDSRLVFDEIVPGSEWVIDGEGQATVKIDGTACMILDGKLYKRYDRKLTKSAHKRKVRNPSFVPGLEHFKAAPDGWEPCEPEPNAHTGHWPGWVPVGDGPEDKYHREAWNRYEGYHPTFETTRELVGPAIQGNPYDLSEHYLWSHDQPFYLKDDPPRDFDALREWFKSHEVEGIVWHHSDGRMVKIKRRDFGLSWPCKKMDRSDSDDLDLDYDSGGIVG